MATRPQLGQSEVGTVVGTGARVVLGRWLYDFILSLTRNPEASVYAVTVTASPATITNTSAYDQDLILSGGTVSSVQFVRAGVFVTTPTSGAIRLNPGDAALITYSVAPLVYVVPR